MKTLLIFTLIMIPFGAFAGDGPTNLGKISIGMSKSEYLSTLGVSPINCNTYKNNEGKFNRSEMKYLRPDTKNLCWDFKFEATGSIENISVADLNYDVIQISSLSSIGGASEYLKQFGHSSQAIFLKDRLVSIQITFPNVGIETLTTKYGEPNIVDNRKVEVCKNRIGNEFKNAVGDLDAVWVNNKVQAIFRVHASPPQKTCSDGINMPYYILQESEQIKLIENAINKYLKEISKEAVNNSPF